MTEGGVPDGYAPHDEQQHQHNKHLDTDMAIQHDHTQQNGSYNIDGRSPVSPGGGPAREGGIDAPKPGAERNRSRTRAGRTPSGNIRLCKKCGEPLTGQFVRALGGTFHLECFKCRVC